MKKNITKILITIVLILFSNGISRPQNTNLSEFLPLKVGNVWVYTCSQSGHPQYFCGLCTKKFRVILTDTSVIDGKTYYHGNISVIQVSGYCYGECLSNLPDFSSYIRVDSLTGEVLQYSANGGCAYRPNEILLDSLKMHLYDSIWYNCQPPVQWYSYVCMDTNNTVIFGQNRQCRRYGIEGFEGGNGRTYVKGIGITAGGVYRVYCNNSSQLLGCVIDGVVYGDTSTIVGLRRINSEVPEEYSLSQNYPNPFNPVTKIKFSLPLPSKGGAMDVKLVVYDVLGREVANLIPPLWGGKVGLSPGTYEVEWSATGGETNYTSGVYFYRLTVSDASAPTNGTGPLSITFSETRKMVLIK